MRNPTEEIGVGWIIAQIALAKGHQSDGTGSFRGKFSTITAPISPDSAITRTVWVANQLAHPCLTYVN
ncbi:hypothetical protein RFM68_28590 [Mesorhizobium sp. MSK_1335]|uniref:Uncharacterized protein n=1 Tax=Mesorhizobium montanum TaxID=3072323 RepID=A0ABU4ZST5_9HYPH|nr:hypothetical protein [Mesorhizobium sp. MSK_1335]MDX8528443.1 hypothetical protein [Mesorhizobium sp. MSK_1335]